MLLFTPASIIGAELLRRHFVKDFHWPFVLLFSARSTWTWPAVYQIGLVHLIKLCTSCFIS